MLLSHSIGECTAVALFHVSAVRVRQLPIEILTNLLGDPELFVVVGPLAAAPETVSLMSYEEGITRRRERKIVQCVLKILTLLQQSTESRGDVVLLVFVVRLFAALPPRIPEDFAKVLWHAVLISHPLGEGATVTFHVRDIQVDQIVVEAFTDGPGNVIFLAVVRPVAAARPEVMHRKRWDRKRWHLETSCFSVLGRGFPGPPPELRHTVEVPVY